MGAGLAFTLLAVGLLTGALAGGLWRVGRRHAEADWGHRGLNVLDGLNRMFCTRFHRLRHDPVALPAQGGVLVVANHVSGLDPLLMAAACRRPLRFIIAREQYERPLLRTFFRAIGCIPVDRDRRPEQALRAALKALAAGEAVALFPHGRIHLDTDPPRPLKGGVAWLAKRTGAPIHPLRLTGVRGAGHTVLAVFMRSRARLQAFPAQYCTEGDDCLGGLAPLLEGRATKKTSPLSVESS
ncbi:1-acyl-sn-glycerol-3-phosphate acyltransferase [Ectothiorhodospiraceae bacterium 2226]|nr:1-acyl-sn-glycerol-3-phosphate acyltransferase [Ectothiorhodospiraceae bacterium 2226]